MNDLHPWSATRARGPLDLLALLLLACLAAGPALAQSAADPNGVTLDFTDVELPAVIDTIAKLTGRNFIYDERVRGRITIVSPTPVSVDQAYAVFESVLQVKGFTTVTTPGGAIKIVPIREAKESSIETVRSSHRPPNRDHFVTRLIPLNYIDAESIVNTLKPLVSKDAAMAAYAPTNTVILTESSSNIRRIIQILESIDIETYKEELAVIPIEHADAVTLADQISEIYGAQVSTTPSATSRRSTSRSRRTRTADAASATAGTKPVPVRILTDERTNSLLVLAPRTQLEEVRGLVAKLDVPVVGGGRIHVYYLRNANAEETAQTLSGLLSGSASPTSGGTTGAATSGQAAALRSTVASLTDGISVTADPATNALIIQASKEGFETLSKVIEKLDIERPQVLVEALIMEVSVDDSLDLGFSAVYRYMNGDIDFAVKTASTAVLGSDATDALDALGNIAGSFAGFAGRDTIGDSDSGSVIQGLIRASATDSDFNVISAPHILTSDNEQAEIRIGDNIPIITSRVQSAEGRAEGLSSSVNVERQDIGVTLRVTPQITEGDTLRMEIFQEITGVNTDLSETTGDAEEVGVSLTNRRIENTVVVANGETVIVGGLLGDTVDDAVSKVPWLGDIPVLGWLFKSTRKTTRKQNLLVFLTPYIIRSAEDLESETIRKREEFRHSTGDSLQLSEKRVESERLRLAAARAEGIPYTPEYEGHPVRGAVAGHEARYPRTRVGEIAREKAAQAEAARIAAEAADRTSYFLQAAIFEDPDSAATLLTELYDSGHDGKVVSTTTGEAILYEVHVGPFLSVGDARKMGAALGRAHGLEPAVLVVESEPEPEDE